MRTVVLVTCCWAACASLPAVVSAQGTSIPLAMLSPSAVGDDTPPPAPRVDPTAGPRGSATGALLAMLRKPGRYEYVLDRAASDDVPSAIERTIAHMNFIIRPIARHRLARTNRVPAHLTFIVRPDTLVVSFENVNPISTPLNGQSVPWVSGVSREVYHASVTASGTTLHQLIQASDGSRTDDFAFLDDGARVLLHVTLAAERLPRPLTYLLVFRRASEQEN